MRALNIKTLFGAALAVAAFCAPRAAQAQIFFNDIPVERGPMEPTDPLVGAPLPGATLAEARAALVWNMRAGLNNAALQCQQPLFTYLRAVDNYNAILAHHGDEFTAAFRTIEGYFRRVNGARGQHMLDQWNTLTYNRWSSFRGQSAFCQTAGDVAKDALTRRKGAFYELARARMRELRSSQLVVQGDLLFTPGGLPPLPMSLFAPPLQPPPRSR
jgi:hypothetical protein